MVSVGAVTRAMIEGSRGNVHDSVHDIEHFLKVLSYARIIAEGEGITGRELYTIEIAALVHDIACPLCRGKYASTAGPYQERESEPLLRAFFSPLDVEGDVVERVVQLVSHHHSWGAIEGRDFTVLLEADFIVNAHESAMGMDAIKTAHDTLFKTHTGKWLLETIYGVDQ